MTSLALQNVTKRYGDAVILDRLSVVFPPGQTTALIGPSGCGKSTVLGLLTGLVTPDGGEVDFDGKPLTPPRLPEIRRRIGYVIQDGGLFPHLSGRSNVTLMARHLGTPPDQIARRVAELGDLTRLPAAVLDRLPAEMSGGQRQRVALMRALMLDPEVLLLDEPLAALDPMVRADLQRDLADAFARLKKTIVLVTHDLGEAALFGDEIVLLRAGRVVQRGKPADLMERPAEPFVRDFTNAFTPAARGLQRSDA